MANDGHQIAVAARLRPENTKAVLAIVEGDPLHKAGEYFLGRWFKIGLHTIWKPRFNGSGRDDLGRRTEIAQKVPILLERDNASARLISNRSASERAASHGRRSLIKGCAVLMRLSGCGHVFGLYARSVAAAGPDGVREPFA